MKILVIGSGGREYALAWKLLQSPEVERVLVAPGNGGTALLPDCENLELEATDGVGLLREAEARGVELVVIGPELPLVAGVADLFDAAEIPVVGASRGAAALEGSKLYAKRFMDRHAVPTARWSLAETPEEAMAAFKRLGPPAVLKADGLAAGKGVVVAGSLEEAEETVQRFMVDRTLGAAGSPLIVEECLFGTELSLFALTDGGTYRVLATAMDHKPIGEGNSGPNTGGMGVVAPHPQENEALLKRLCSAVLDPTVRGIASDRLAYRGVLFLGIMLTEAGSRVLEYNVRLGDPETQALLPLLESDLLPLLRATALGKLDQVTPRWRSQVAVSVVAAAKGYPGSYDRGVPIEGVTPPENRRALWEHPNRPIPFIAGAARAPGGGLQTSGGRVLTVTGLGDDVEGARAQAYGRLSTIEFRGMQYRTDIPYLPAAWTER
ncbi:MAG: phosphoribosylamine--glycine ligase [Spirochaetaceae bacterium]